MATMHPIASLSDVHEQIPHAVWLDGPQFSASQVGVRGIAYGTYQAPRETAVEPHVLILYVSAETTVQRRFPGRLEQAEVRHGDISLQPAATAARWGWRDPIEVLHIYISPAKLRAVAREVYGADLRGMELRHSLQIRDPMLTKRCLEFMHELASPRAIGAEVTARAIGDRLIVHLLRDYVAVRKAPTDADRIAKVRDYITEHLGESLELDELADHVGLSKHHFSRIFREALDQSPMEYVRERRLVWARNLLEGTDSSISDIAMTCGFSDQSHLTRWFKRHFGLPPARWRRTYAESV